jgi:hypothetical protein
MDLLAAVLIALVVWVLVLTTAVAVGLWALGRHNRVVTSQPTAAPLSWLWSPAQPARLHRRLRTAAGWVDGDPSPARDHLRTSLVDQAVALDLQVVRAAQAPRRHRRPLVREAAAQVTEVERLAARIHGLASPAAGTQGTRPAADPTVAEHLRRLREHVELLEAANVELADIERHAGLGDAPDLPAPASAGRASGAVPAPPPRTEDTTGSHPVGTPSTDASTARSPSPTAAARPPDAGTRRQAIDTTGRDTPRPATG